MSQVLNKVTVVLGCLLYHISPTGLLDPPPPHLISLLLYTHRPLFCKQDGQHVCNSEGKKYITPNLHSMGICIQR